MLTYRHAGILIAVLGAALLAILSGSRDARADTIVLKTGEKRTGVEIVQAQWDQVQYRQSRNRPAITLAGNQVISIARESPILERLRKQIDGGEYDKAKGVIERVPPDQAWVQATAMYLLGVARAAEGKSKEAAADFQAYLKKFESSKDWYVPHATVGLAEALLKDRKPSQATIQYKKLSTFGGTWDLYAKLGQAESLVQSKGAAAALEARRLYDEVVRSRGVPVQLKQKAHVGRARVFLLQKQADPAIKELEQGFFASPKPEELAFTAERAEASLLMGRAYQSLGGKENLEKAEIWLLRVPALYGKHVATFQAACDALVEVYGALGNQRRADEWKARKAAAAQK